MEFTTNNLSEALERYASLTITLWANVQPGQRVLITGDRKQKQLIELLAERAKSLRNSGSVDIYWKDSSHDLVRLNSESAAELSVPDPALIQLSEELVNGHGCLISIVEGPESRAFAEIDPEKAHALEKAKDLARAVLRKRGLGENRITRCLLAAAAPDWAETLFPHEPVELRELKLWKLIFESCCIFENYPEEAFRAVEKSLAKNRDQLQQLELKELRFTGKGTDLRVGLSSEALWLSSEKQNRDGIPYFANVPIGEIFTTPDYRRTAGTVRCTMPSIVSEAFVDGIQLRFEAGEVVQASATTGDAHLQLLLNTDEGSRRLGEVALVGEDAPLFHTDVLFRETLFDEKGKSHIALGDAYRNCIKNGASLSPEDIFVLGINQSTVHHDVMIGDAETVVTGLNRSGTIPILQGGKWVFPQG